MPRDSSKSDEITTKNCRYSPFERRTPVEMSTPPSTPPPPMPVLEDRLPQQMPRYPEPQQHPMASFHAKVVQILNNKVEQRELELVSDAETLSADEGSESSRDSWNNNAGYGGHAAPQPLDLAFPFRDSSPRVVVVPMPNHEPLDEPMEVVEEQPALDATAAEESDLDDDDNDSENTSFWDSDDDEEIQQVFLLDSRGEVGEKYNSDVEELASGRAHVPEVLLPLYYESSSEPPSPPPVDFPWVGALAQLPEAHWPGHLQPQHHLQAAAYWPAGPFLPPPAYEQDVYWHVLGQPEPLLEQPIFDASPEPAPRYDEGPVELMDQDDSDSSFEDYDQCEPQPFPIDYRLQPQLEPLPPPMHDDRESNYYYPRYGLRNEAARQAENRRREDMFAAHQSNRCNHCGNAIEPLARQIASRNEPYMSGYLSDPPAPTDFSVNNLLSKRN